MYSFLVRCFAVCVVPLGVVHSVERIAFNRDVRPILSDNCFFCHGPDKNHREADLRLDIREEAVDRAFVMGKPNESVLIERIHSDDAELVMPPLSSHKKLTTKQKDILKQWIEQGAEYQLHWSYEKPVKSTIPSEKNAIDTFIENRQMHLGIKISLEADRRILIRRLYADLLGLPPNPEEVAKFENDRDPDAYSKLVDRILDNPHYGERMAMGWLDVVRFADTIGYHSDTPRNIWPYRDWVIKSFNDNKSFDRFTIEQLAGDLLPNASQDTRVASAFNRLLLTTEEGGAQPKDYEQRMLTDRVRAIGAAWLGQTTGCAQCHDHKFDPITMRDFYSLGAFFADIQEAIVGKREDGMLVATPDEVARLEELDAALKTAKKKYDDIVPQLQTAQKQWEADIQNYGITLPELRDESKANQVDIAKAKKVVQALAKSGKNRKKPDLDLIEEYFLERGTTLFKTERKAYEAAKKARDGHYNALPKCLVSVSTPDKRTVRILPRGNWMDETGEIVKPALPSYLPQNKIEGRELTRLDLAEWLVSAENPLTARTLVNRLWKQFFGTGLSKVLDDLGAQGEPPVNPLLLDWLACEFVDSGWDVKHMVRTIVHSKAYRQSSTATPQLLTADPYNRELARQSAFRLEAELVRDQALSLSGLLVPKIGGPSVKPYQPDGYWENLNFPVRTYPTDSGEAQYRRGLYTWWQRSFLHPSMLAFDAPSREECCAERNRSNIPQQALVLLNDPTYVEAARAFAVRILAEAKGEDSEKIDWAWLQALQRRPTEKEKSLMLKLLGERREAYRANAASADDLSKVGYQQAPDSMDRLELAAWTHVTRVLLNLHETISRT
jgi:Protein of unknown function (DUF1553)/Protein of unknown function (DUF1549)/Planctomycete cytochrome C